MDLVHINLYGVSIYGADSSFIFINKIVSHIKLTAKVLHSIKHIIIDLLIIDAFLWPEKSLTESHLVNACIPIKALL